MNEIAQYFQFHLATQRIPLHLVGKLNLKTNVYFPKPEIISFLTRSQNFEKKILLLWSCMSVRPRETTRLLLDRFS